MYNYVLSYNPLSGNPSEGQLLNHVQFNRFVQQFYQPFAGTYLLKSNQTAVVLNGSLSGFFERAPYILVQFPSALAGGKLPPEIWNWVNFNALPTVPTEVPTIASQLNTKTLTDYLRELGSPKKP